MVASKKEDVVVETGPASEVEEMKAEVAELRSLLQKVGALGKFVVPDDGPKKIQRADKPGDGGGWVAQTPMEYWGVAMGIEFRGGVGIVDVELPNAEEIVHNLEHDFGYKVQAVEGAELAEIRKLQAMMKKPDQSILEKLRK
jgi:hypothetical protein